MYKYFTKCFRDTNEIDPWLASFEREVLAGEGNCAEVVGYVSLGEDVVITIKRWEVSPLD